MITEEDRQRIAKKSRRLTLNARARRGHWLGGITGPLVGCDKDGNPYQHERPVGQPGTGKARR